MEAKWLVAVVAGITGGVAAGFTLGRRRRALLATGAEDEQDDAGILAYPAGEPGHVFQTKLGTRTRKDRSKTGNYVDAPAASDLRDSASGYNVGSSGVLYLRFDQMEQDLVLTPESRFTMPGQVGMLYQVSDDDRMMSRAILSDLVKSGAAVAVPVNLLLEDRPRKKATRRNK